MMYVFLNVFLKGKKVDGKIFDMPVCPGFLRKSGLIYYFSKIITLIERNH